MATWSVLLLALVLSTALRLGQSEFTDPEQIAIAATDSYSGIVVTWVTFNRTETSEVQYGIHSDKTDLSKTAKGDTTKFVVGDVNRFIHRTTLRNLVPLAKYDYRCGSPANWSQVLTLRTLGDHTSSPTLAFYGDFGLENARSLPWLIDDVNRERFDAVLHAGDMAYNLFNDEGRVGDDFMNQIQDVASRVPYMVAPGNHEWLDNFTHYIHRFSMPGNKEGLMYSWTVGPVRVISFNTEFYFFLWYGVDLIKWQYQWLEEQLAMANTPEERNKHPWIITIAHHPMYCTTIDEDDCDHYNSVVRVGEPTVHKFGLENLFYKYGVDIELWGHEHIYERFWPLYDFTVYNGSLDAPYTDPKAPIHIVSGSAGCREKHAGFQKEQPDWMAFRSEDYGYSRIKVYNHTHVTVEQISADQDGTVIDKFTIIKHYHGPYN
ncbi:acid phosphatase type 7-like isoform X2 [Halichondria panicea]|uniref:acid phosphatase type 7-like isoform X2 n=1 Tax=Halichondria panicea TaxID=6063 RepID=UPI00312BB5AD